MHWCPIQLPDYQISADSFLGLGRLLEPTGRDCFRRLLLMLDLELVPVFIFDVGGLTVLAPRLFFAF